MAQTVPGPPRALTVAAVPLPVAVGGAAEQGGARPGMCMQRAHRRHRPASGMTGHMGLVVAVGRQRLAPSYVEEVPLGSCLQRPGKGVYACVSSIIS